MASAPYRQRDDTVPITPRITVTINPVLRAISATKTTGEHVKLAEARAFGVGCCRIQCNFLLAGGMRPENGIDGTATQSMPNTTLSRWQNSAEGHGNGSFSPYGIAVSNRHAQPTGLCISHDNTRPQNFALGPLEFSYFLFELLDT